MIENLIKSKDTPPQHILYLSLDNPLFSDIALEKLLHFYLEEMSLNHKEKLFIFFDEIQYLKDWEVHLKSLVDSYPAIQFTVSGSAAAALKLKSQESGAGRFTDFLLPPLSFYEYCKFINFTPTESSEDGINLLNKHFVDYINYGGFPEAVFSDSIKQNFQRFVGQDVVEKVLLRDLPSLYGITDPQELYRFFTTIAYNTGEEVSIDKLSKSSGVTKNTIYKYLDFLEAAFLIKRVKKIDDNFRKFQRTTNFKVYLTNPSLRTALFGPAKPDIDHFGKLVETAVFAQHMHSFVFDNTYYARWKSGQGEVDLVTLDPEGQPYHIVEIKWSNRMTVKDFRGLVKLGKNLKKNRMEECLTLMLSKSREESITQENIPITITPASFHSYIFSRDYITIPSFVGLHPATGTIINADKLMEILKNPI